MPRRIGFLFRKANLFFQMADCKSLIRSHLRSRSNKSHLTQNTSHYLIIFMFSQADVVPLLTWMAILSFVTTLLLFWVDFIPGFGFVSSFLLYLVTAWVAQWVEHWPAFHKVMSVIISWALLTRYPANTKRWANNEGWFNVGLTFGVSRV